MDNINVDGTGTGTGDEKKVEQKQKQKEKQKGEPKKLKTVQTAENNEKIELFGITKKNKAKRARKTCDGCDRSGLEVELYDNIYMLGIYCDECLEDGTDDYGDPLECHKWEPVFYRGR